MIYLTEKLNKLVEMNQADWMVDGIERMLERLNILHRRPLYFLILQKNFEKDVAIQYYVHATNSFEILPINIECAVVVSDPETFEIIYTARYSAMPQRFSLYPWQIFVKGDVLMTFGEYIYGDSKAGDAHPRRGMVEASEAIREG
jgi:hypothetical protein